MNIKTSYWRFATFLFLLFHLSPVIAQDLEDFRQLLATSDSLVYGDPNRSLELAERAIAIANLKKSDSLLAEAKYRKGSAYWSRGDLSMALDELNNVQRLVNSEEVPLLLANVQKRIGTLYSGVGDNLTAIKYYKQAATNYGLNGRAIGVMGSYNNIGNSFRELREFDSAILYLDKALTLLGEDENFVAPILNFNMAEVYYDAGQFEYALPYVERCRELSVKRQDKRGIIRANQLIAEIMLNNGEVAIAEKLAREADDFAQYTDSKDLISKTSGTMANVLFAKGHFEEAYTFQRKAAVYQDSLRSNENQSRLNFYQVKKTQDALEALRKEKAISELQSRNFQIVMLAICAVAVLAIALAIVFYRSRVLFGNANRQLEQKNEEIESQRQELKELNDFKTRLIAIVSHDLKAPIQGLLGILDLLEKRMATAKDLETIVPDMRLKVKSNYEKIVDLLQWSSRDIQRAKESEQIFMVEECIKEASQDLTLEADNKQISVHYELAAKQETIGDRRILKTIIRNLISNAIKFSSTGGEILIKSSELSDKVMVSIKDYGTGMAEGTVANLFKRNLGSAPGTLGERGSGLGLVICKDLLDMINGTIWVETEVGEGSEFFLTVPRA